MPRDIVILGGTPWDPASNQTSGQMAVALATAGNRVMYVARSTQSSRLRGFSSHLRGFGQRLGSPKAPSFESGLQLVAPNLWYLNLHGPASFLPLSYPEILRRFQLRNLRRVIHTAQTRLSFHEPLLWCYWWFFPEFVHEYAESVFDVVDAYDAYPINAAWPSVNATHARLAMETAASATLTVAVSEALACHYAPASRTLLLKPNGIDTERVGRALLRPLRAKRVSGTVIGYAGGTSSRIDWQLVRGLALGYPDVIFEFHGGEAPNDVELPSNTVFYGFQTYDDILDSIRLFDLAILPFENSEFTRASNFLKLLDYIAMGVPVVGPPLPAVLRLAEQFPDLVYVAGDLFDWSAKIAGALRSRSNEEIPEMSDWSSSKRAAEVLDGLQVAAQQRRRI